MPNAELRINDTTRIDHGPHILEIDPVLVVAVGTTMAELLLVLPAQLAGLPDLVPWRGLLVDSLPYEDVVVRLVQNGWTRRQVLEAIPRARYFHLNSPFSEDFDFDNPLNRAWRSTLFEPALQRLAARPNAPGCAGTPALGRARVEGNAQELREFFEQHLQQLTQVRTDTLALLEGVRAFVITTYRGGTGAGAATSSSGVLRSAMDGGQIHLHAIMPCVYLGDEHAQAKAYAMLRENQWYHRYNGGIPMKDGRLLKAPFDTATYVFARNGTVTLGPVDALMQEAAVLRAYLRATTQAAINVRHVDCTDVVPYDIHDQPLHVRVETALSIRAVQPGVQEYLTAEWLRQELAAVQERFETWTQTGALTHAEDAQVQAVVQEALKNVKLDRDALLARLDPSPAPMDALHNFFGQTHGRIDSMKARAIKQNIVTLPDHVRESFQKFERAWEDGTRQLVTTLPQEIAAYVARQMAAAPHLGLAALSKICQHLTTLSEAATQDAEREQQRRETAGAQLSAALHAVQRARGALGFIHTDEVTRDAARTACGIALAAARARAQQQRLTSLAKALVGEASVTQTLCDFQVEQMAATRQRQIEQLQRLTARLEDLEQSIEKRSQVFQRSLVFDGMHCERLNVEVQAIRKRLPHAPPVRRFLAQQQDLSEACEELLPLLPSYAESQRGAVEILDSDPLKQREVVQLLRNRRPFTPIDRQVEDQQGLRNRRDGLVILEIPGGQDGSLADLMLREGVVAQRDQIVESGDDEIRLYTLRDGLPYGAISSLARYRERHDSYLQNPAAITPYSVPNAHQLPGIEPARTNLREHTHTLLSVARAVLPQRVASLPSGGFRLRYDRDASRGFRSTQEESFADFPAMVAWVAKRVEVRKGLEAELKGAQDAHPDAYSTALIAAWEKASGVEQEYLSEVLSTSLFAQSISTILHFKLLIQRRCQA